MSSADVLDGVDKFNERRYYALADELANVYVGAGYQALGEAVRGMIEDDRLVESELANLRPYIRGKLDDMGYELDEEENPDN